MHFATHRHVLPARCGALGTELHLDGADVTGVERDGGIDRRLRGIQGHEPCAQRNALGAATCKLVRHGGIDEVCAQGALHGRAPSAECACGDGELPAIIHGWRQARRQRAHGQIVAVRARGPSRRRPVSIRAEARRLAVETEPFDPGVIAGEQQVHGRVEHQVQRFAAVRRELAQLALPDAVRKAAGHLRFKREPRRLGFDARHVIRGAAIEREG